MSFQGFCFVNFKQLAVVNDVVGDIDASLLFGAIKYQVSNTKIVRGADRVIARTRRQLANYLNCSLKSIDRKLEQLKSMSLIQTVLGMWYGKKRMFVRCKEDIKFSVNIRKLQFLNSYTGGNKASVALSYFAYMISLGKPNAQKGWCSVPKLELANLLGLTLKGAYAIVIALEQKGLIVRTPRHLRHYVTINSAKYDELMAEWERIEHEAKHKKETIKSHKRTILTTSINNRDINTVEIINNNTNNVDYLENTGGDVNFNQDESKLNKRQLAYAKAAVERTVLKAKVAVGDIKTLWSQVHFALSTPEHRQGTQNFKHAVNRFMLLIRSGGWRMPFGYEKYSDECKDGYLQLKAREKKHYELKSGAQLARLQARGEIPPELGIDVPDAVYEPPAAIEVDVQDAERRRKLEDLQRRWEIARYGGA
jgi:hypothetical protein